MDVFNSMFPVICSYKVHNLFVKLTDPKNWSEMVSYKRMFFWYYSTPCRALLQQADKSETSWMYPQ